MEYYYKTKTNQEAGPVSREILAQLLLAGELTPGTLIRPANGTNWKSYRDLNLTTEDASTELASAIKAWRPTRKHYMACAVLLLAVASIWLVPLFIKVFNRDNHSLPTITATDLETAINNRLEFAVQSEIDSNSKKNTEALLKMPISIDEFVLLIGHSRPNGITVDFTDLRFPSEPKVQQTVTLRGMVEGRLDLAATVISDYVDLLRAHPRLGAIFDPITLEKFTPDATTGFMSFEISLKVKTEGKNP